MNCDIISIGDELLIGQVVNTNASWLADLMSRNGFKIRRIVTISDDAEEIIDAIEESYQKSDVVLTTGGLGPTSDDRTKQVLADYFGAKLVENEEVVKDVQRLFALRGVGLTELNRQQAMVPDNCTVIRNENGTAPGMWFEKDNKVLVSMPGVPFEMEGMMRGEVLEKLLGHFSTDVFVYRNVLTQGIGESFLADKIKSWEENLPLGVSLAYLPSAGMVRLRLSARGKDRKELMEIINNEIDQLKPLISEYIWGYDEDTLAEVVGRLLKSEGAFLSTAESCTGGYISHLITSVAGSSAYYKGSVVAYANEVKMQELGVRKQTLDRFGAVSEETVREMVVGVQKKFGVKYGISVSGIAGPDGGTPEKPVGTVWIAVAKDEEVYARKFLIGTHRQRNIQRAGLSALMMLYKLMSGKL